MAEVESRSVHHVTWQEIYIMKQLKFIDLCVIFIPSIVLQQS